MLIDISKWHEFQVSDLFITEKLGNSLQVPTGSWIAKKDLREGTTPRITVSNFDNGITGYYSDIDSNDYRVYENFISVSFLGTVFYQPVRASLDMKVHCLKPIDYSLNVFSASFLVTVIRKAISYYAYADQLSSTVLAELSFKLPVDSSSQPDWKYMESFMKQQIEESKINLGHLLKTDDKKHNIDFSSWKKFHLYDDCLFDIDMGTKLDKAKMKETNPKVNFVGRANSNNGITTCVNIIDGITPYPAGYMTLSLGGEYLGSCFIQPKPFYTSQNVVVLIPKVEMSDNVKRFIATMIFRESRLHYKAFIDELNRHIKTDFEIFLPVKSDGFPDWDYMDDFMESIMNKAERDISLLEEIDFT